MAVIIPQYRENYRNNDLRGEVIRYAKKKNKTKNNNNNNNNNLDTFVRKKDFFMEKLSARGYNNTELSKADFSINFEDRQHFIKEKPKSTSIPLVFKTKYNPHFAKVEIFEK